MFFGGSNEKQAVSPRLPAFLPWYSAPWAWAASSMTAMPRSFAASRIGSISAVWPYKWTGMTAAVRRVKAAEAFEGSMLYDVRSTSAKTGFAPHRTTVEAVAKNVSGGMTTSAPALRPCARRATWSAAVPFATAIPCFRPTSRANPSSNAFTFAPWASMPDDRTSLTAASSSSPRIGRAIGIIGARNRIRRMKVRRSLPVAGTSLAPRLQVRVRAAVVGAAHARVERPAAFADPADSLRRDAGDEGVRRDVLRDDRTSGDHRVPADRDAAEDRRVRTD